MSKSILVLTGSPRKNGNSDMLANAFIKGAESAGHTCTKFDAAFHEIRGCRACGTCWQKDGPCSFNAEFNKHLAPLLEKAEVLVLAMPLYFYGFPAQIKAALDPMYAYAVPQKQRNLQITESAFIICGGDTAEASYGGALESYRQMAKYCGWADKGTLWAGGLHEKGEVANTEHMAKAEAMGKSI